MIDTHEIINIEGLTVEVNWNPETIPCKVIKFIIDGKECIISRAELYSLLFLFGDENQQEQLIPVKSDEVSMMKRWIGIRLKRDMKKGETVRVIAEFPVEQRVQEKFQIDIAKEMKRSMTPINYNT